MLARQGMIFAEAAFIPSITAPIICIDESSIDQGQLFIIISLQKSIAYKTLNFDTLMDYFLGTEHTSECVK